MTTQRRLAAIVCADVVGYSRLIGIDEAGTLARLAALRREIVEPAVARHAGRLFKQTGDGFLVEFASAVEAVGCAVEIQKAAGADALPLRIGIHVGDVVVEGDDLMGDGVNIAARIEGVADVGGIAISRQVHDQVRDRLDVPFVDKGEVELKNLARPVHVFAVTDTKAAAATTPALALPDKPSIAVLPFQNMSGDPEQKYFADGMVEDIITALSRTRALLVIARNSSFAYKGKSPDIRAVGRELGVRYVLEGSVRRAGGRVRITGQLIDAMTGVHIWADRFEGGQEDVFSLQDQITARVVRAIQPAVLQVEIERSRRRPFKDFNAYDWYLRGLSLMLRYSRDAIDEALKCSYEAMALDTRFAPAFSLAASCHQNRSYLGLMADDTEDKLQAEQLAQRALELDPNDPRVLSSVGLVFVHCNRTADAAALFDRALQLDPYNPVARYGKGWTCIYLGREGALEQFESGLLLNPIDPRAFNAYNGIANAQYLAGDYDGAVESAAKGLRLHAHFLPLLGVTMAAHAMAGRLEEARRVGAIYMQLNPVARVSKYRRWYPLRRDEDFEKVATGLRLAGMPE